MASVLLLCLAFVGHVLAVNFLLPIDGDVWTTSGPNIIWWVFNASEPTFVNIQLLQNNNETFQPIPHLLTAQGIFAQGINITDNVMAFTPSCSLESLSLPTGTGFTVKMFSEMTNGTRTTLGVSTGTFSISAVNATSCSGGSAIEFPLTSSAVIGPTRTASASSNFSASSSKSRAGAIAGGVIGAFCLLVGGASMYIRRRRNRRKRMTQQFVMRKGLVIGKTVESNTILNPVHSP